MFGTASLFGFACLTAFVWDCVLVWLRLFDCVCLGLRPCLAARQTKPTGLNLE